jgi:hypothetical protein
MKYRGIGIAIIAIILVLGEAHSFAQSTLSSQNPLGLPQNMKYAPRRSAAQPEVRTVGVQLPVPCAPSVLPPCPSGEVRYGPSRTMPVRVEVAVKPEFPCDGRRIPVMFRDPGPLQPIISHGVGLIGATIAAPFRIAEALCPCPQQTCKPARALPCGPMPPAPPMSPVCHPAHAPCVSDPHACPQPVAWAPVGPTVAPLPSASCAPRCGPNVPPRLVEEYQFPQYEAQDLLSGLWNLPGTLIRTGRVAGDIHKDAPCAPPVCR